MLVLEIYEPNSDWLRILRHRNRFAARLSQTLFFRGEKRLPEICLRSQATIGAASGVNGLNIFSV